MGRPQKYISDEERYKSSNEYHRDYGTQPWKCESCNIELTYNSRTKHLKSKKHLKTSYKPWKCDICNIEIHIDNKANHLQTKKHRFIEEFSPE